MFLLLYSLCNKEYKYSLVALCDLVASYLTAGIILIPGLIGGVVTQNSSASQETSSDWSQWAYISLNPFNRFSDLQLFYFGLSIFIVIVLGILTFRKSTLPGFLSAIIIYFGTTMVVLPIVSALPMSQVFWMIRFIPMSEMLFLISLIYWKDLKKIVLIIFLCIQHIPIPPIF